jgi:acyl-CoA synthetase (AMP-forming)/AMP-acid ligase II
VANRGSTIAERWGHRLLPDELARRYRAEGWWTDTTLGTMVEDGLGAKGSVPFWVRSGVRPWQGTYAELDRAARSLAASLAADGVGPGDVVVFQLPNWAEAGVAFFAAAYLGAVVVPVVHFYGSKEVGYIVDATDPDVVITGEKFGHADYLTVYEELLRDRTDTRWLVVGERAAAELPAAAGPLRSLLDGPPLDAPLHADPDAPTLIGFTSGTTRDPKGVVHSHNTIGFEARQLNHMFPVGGPPPIVSAPVGHFIGMLNAFLVPLLRDLPVNLLDQWDPGEVLRLMREENLGVSGGATYFLTSLLDHPDFGPEHLANIPFAGLGGAPVPVAVTRRAAAMGIAAFRSYGSTEHPSITGCQIDEAEEKRLTTDGHPLPGVEVRLGEDGEIYSRGPDCCIGYTDPALTAETFDVQGWYRTGDVGTLDDEGYLTIVDRVADVIIRGGENISAGEVEELVLGLDAVAEVAVVAEPDDRLGERAAAFLRLRDGRQAPTLPELRAHLEAAGLARQKWPESIYPVEDFPRTASGKVQKFRLRQQLRDGAANGQTKEANGNR